MKAGVWGWVAIAAVCVAALAVHDRLRGPKAGQEAEPVRQPSRSSDGTQAAALERFSNAASTSRCVRNPDPSTP